MKAKWIKAAPDALPDNADWVLIVIDGTNRGVPDCVGLGWRKFSSDWKPTGWWETSHGLMMDKCITHWAPVPELPKK